MASDLKDRAQYWVSDEAIAFREHARYWLLEEVETVDILQDYLSRLKKMVDDPHCDLHFPKSKTTSNYREVFNHVVTIEMLLSRITRDWERTKTFLDISDADLDEELGD